MKSNLNQVTKIVGAIVLALMFSFVLQSEVFLANSPKIRPNLPQYLAAKINGAISRTLAFLPHAKTTAELKEELLQKTTAIAPGVRAASNENGIYTEYDDNNVQWEVRTITLSDGRTVRVRIPKGVTNAVPPLE